MPTSPANPNVINWIGKGKNSIMPMESLLDSTLYYMSRGFPYLIDQTDYYCSPLVAFGGYNIQG